MSWRKTRCCVLFCAGMMSISILYLVQYEVAVPGGPIHHVPRQRSASPSWTLSEYPSYDESLTCNPVLVEPIPFPSPSPIPFRNLSELCPPMRSFSALDADRDVLTLSSGCQGAVQVLLSDGYQTWARTAPATPTRIALGGAQQIVAKCLRSGDVNSHIRVRFPPDNPVTGRDHHRSRPHVVVLVLDSVSRAQFVRQFPATGEVLRRIALRRQQYQQQQQEHYHQHRHQQQQKKKKRHQYQHQQQQQQQKQRRHHRLYEFRRYSTGGVGTAGNLVPILSGQAIRHWRARHQLLDLLNVSRVERHDRDGNLFSLFRTNGYRTSLMDESGPHWSSSLIRYFASGTATPQDLDALVRSLTDWTFYSMVETMLRVGAPFDPRLIYADTNVTALCVGDRTLEQIEFERLRQTLRVAERQRSPVFSVTLFNTAHEPRVRRAPTLDQPLAAFIEDTIESHPNTALIVLSDHGIGYGPYAISDIGLFENKLPALFLILPESLPLSDRQWSRLERNQDRLVFPLDLYQTLAYLANPLEYDDDDDDGDDDGEGEGASLFHLVQPAWRNCTSVAGRYDVDYKFCACIGRRPLRAPLFGVLAQAVVTYINREARSSHVACEPVGLRSFAAHSLDEFHRTGPERVAVKVTVASASVATHPDRSTNGTEIFTGYFKRRMPRARSAAVKMEIGQGWDPDQDRFLGPVALLDRDAAQEVVHVLISSRRRRRSALRLALYRVGIRKPVSRLYTVVDLEQNEFESRLVANLGRADQFRSGRWLAILKSGNIIISTMDFIVTSSAWSSEEAPSIEALLDQIWEIDTVRRDTEFGQYEACAGPIPNLSFCLCNLSRPLQAAPNADQRPI